MVAICQNAPIPVPIDQVQAGFEAMLPRIEHTVSYHFRYIACPDRRADAVAEAVALAWTWYRRCANRGVDAGQFATTLADYAARHVRGGRGVCGQRPATDALSIVAQRRHGFKTVPLPGESSLVGPLLSWALTDNTRSPVPDQVQFRCDFPEWLRHLSGRDRRVVRQLLRGDGTGEVARDVGLTMGRVSQLRRTFRDDWEAFCGLDD